MTDRESRGSHLTIVWGALILFIGVVLLLQATSVLEWQIWGTLWKFWPVLIVLIGLSILLRRVSAWIMALSALVVFGICLWISALQYMPSLAHDLTIVDQRFTYPTLGVERVNATIESGTGSISISDLSQSDNQLLVKIDDGHESQRKPQARLITMQTDFTRKGSTVNVDLSPVNQQRWENWLVRWDLYFNKSVPLSLDVSGDLSSINMHLNALDVKNIRLEMDICNGWLSMPVSAGTTTIDVHMNVSNLEITVPEGVAVKIKADVNLGIFIIDKERFIRQGDYFVSPGYDGAANRVELNIVCDVSRLVIK